MTSLVPEVVDARRIGKDVEQLAIMLSQGMSLCEAQLMIVPGFQYASLLKDVIQKARRNKLLPPASRPGSPKSGATTVPSWNSQPSTSASSQTQQTDISKFTFERQPSELFPALDFSYAEQLLASNGNGPETSQIVCTQIDVADNSPNLDTTCSWTRIIWIHSFLSHLLRMMGCRPIRVDQWLFRLSRCLVRRWGITRLMGMGCCLSSLVRGLLGGRPWVIRT
jgi:hypothetical protein